jgi:hypothetical protein
MIGTNSSAQTIGVFEIRFDDSALTAQQQTELAPTLAATKSYWESIIIGYQPGVALDGIEIEVDAMAIDGSGNTLATGGFFGFSKTQGGFTFITSEPQGNSSSGVVTIDTADFSSALILDVLKHEVGHALGFGTLFDFNSLAPDAGKYIGSEGVAAYQAEFDSTATFVPLQSTGGHLDENNSLSDEFGREVQADLMTPIIENTPNSTDSFSNYLSNTSLGILRDLGYDTVATTYVAPEVTLGDCNLDGVVNFLDITPFISVLSSSGFLEEADCNEDGNVNFLDITPFIAILSGT